MFKGLGNFAAILKEAQQIQGRAEEVQQKLAKLNVEGRAGGEMVVVQANGLQRILGIKIEKSLVESADNEMLEDLLIAAVNQALDKSRELAAEEMAKMTSNLPGLAEAMSKLGLGGPAAGQ